MASLSNKNSARYKICNIQHGNPITHLQNTLFQEIVLVKTLTRLKGVCISTYHKFVSGPADSKESERKGMNSDEGSFSSTPASPPKPQPPLPSTSPFIEKKLTDHRKMVLERYEEKINHLELQFGSASENGLFPAIFRTIVRKHKPDECRAVVDRLIHDFHDNIYTARSYLRDNDVIKCQYYIAKAEITYYNAIYQASSVWRFFNVYAFHLWIFFIGMIPLILSIYYFALYANTEGETVIFGQFPLLAVQAVVWGMIGGLFQDIWYLWRHVHNRDYRNTWMIQYFSAPFIGGILGAIIYIIIAAGLVVLDADASGTPRDFVVMGLAAFAGWNWEWAIKRFEGVAGRFQE